MCISDLPRDPVRGASSVLTVGARNLTFMGNEYNGVPSVPQLLRDQTVLTQNPEFKCRARVCVSPSKNPDRVAACGQGVIWLSTQTSALLGTKGGHSLSLQPNRTASGLSLPNGHLVS